MPATASVTINGAPGSCAQVYEGGLVTIDATADGFQPFHLETPGVPGHTAIALVPADAPAPTPPTDPAAPTDPAPAPAPQ
jgi:hypothetical protein